ncbi:MAG TPA: fimbria/pilus outer membrane usher protein [Arsenophonus nasoniae]|uniref:fimbria/pilus outer membrane usher protein n=1 Tax=Arsenophonus nasoniae TaxID=638 RepID=UPI003879F287
MNCPIGLLMIYKSILIGRMVFCHFRPVRYVLLLTFIPSLVYSTNETYTFDPTLFRGGAVSPTMLAQFNQANSIIPGKYKVDIYINNHFFQSKEITFIENKNHTVGPCFNLETIKQADIIVKSTNKISDQNCIFLPEYIAGSRVKLTLSDLRLDLTIPDDGLQNIPRGYIDPNLLDAGSSILFLNYIGNYYHINNDNNVKDQDTAYLSFNGGMNFGIWQYRQQSNYTYSRQSGAKWNNIRSYLQRPLPVITGMLSLGQLVTQGKFFSGLNFNGLALASDERTLPDSLRGYAPVVQGVANTTATVTIKQNGNQIYQKTVSPGAFSITDLYPTSYNGDLDVEISEADGSVRRFSVPFSAVPESLRPGSYRYNFSVGRTRNIGQDSVFADAIYQYGLSNSFSVSSGLRIADKYQAIMLGGVYGSRFGALGFNTTYSNSVVPIDHQSADRSERLQGWMANLSYSRTFNITNTTISLAGYRYSTDGYRELSDVLGIREAITRGTPWSSSTYRQLNRLELTLSQQLGYNKAFDNGLTMNVVVARQQLAESSEHSGKEETSTSVSFSFPLGSQYSSYTPTVSSSYTHGGNIGDQYQVMLSGTANEQQNLNYSVGASYVRQYNQSTVNGSLQKRFSNTNLSINASKGKNYWQIGANAQGALALHSGGLTFGPYLGDTFALVEAKGASGAAVLNAQGTIIDDNGYALVPSITPYRYNKIILDPQGMAENFELNEDEKQVAPYAGTAVKVMFKTRAGYALLIKAQLADHSLLPIGTEVFDQENNVIGMVGQNNQMYVRTEQASGTLLLKWGETISERCYLDYSRTGQALAKQPITKLTAMCVQR